MEKQPCDINGVSKIRRIPYRTTKKLGRDYEIHKSGTKKYKEAIWQETKKLLRVKNRRQYMVKSQEHSFKSTLKETQPKKIQTL